MARYAVATLSTENLLHNLNILKQVAAPANIMVMLKANSYGHGLRTVALKLDGKVQSFGVASIDEALALRKVNIKSAVTLMSGPFEQEDVLISAIENFHLVIHTIEQITWLEKFIAPKLVNIWIKINTGMGRLGFEPDELELVKQKIENIANKVKIIGVMSHLACAEEINHPLNQLQIEKFKNLKIPNNWQKTLINSGGIFNFPEYSYDLVRAGLALYGISPIYGKTAADLGLKPVMTLQSRVFSVKQFKKGQSVGYGARFVCSKDMKVALIAMGYGDGYPRSAIDGTVILINNTKCPLIGRVSMDMIVADVSTIDNVQIGDPVILWGDGLPIEEVASFTNNIPYDLLCGVQQRVKFFWTK